MAIRGTTKTQTVGLVIAGGASRRFGAEKAVQVLRGRPLLAWSLTALDAVCGEVGVNAQGGSETAGLALGLSRALILDDPDHPRGPLAGVAAGLRWAAERGARVLLTLPTDTPLVTGLDLARLTGAPARAAYAVSPRGPHPLCCAWDVGLVGEIEAALAAGEHPPVRRVLEATGAQAILFEDDRPFQNLNRPDDLERLASSLAAGEGGAP